MGGLIDDFLYEVEFGRDDLKRAVATCPNGQVAVMYPGGRWKRGCPVEQRIVIATRSGRDAVRFAVELGVSVRRRAA